MDCESAGGKRHRRDFGRHADSAAARDRADSWVDEPAALHTLSGLKSHWVERAEPRAKDYGSASLERHHSAVSA